MRCCRYRLQRSILGPPASASLQHPLGHSAKPHAEPVALQAVDGMSDPFSFNGGVFPGTGGTCVMSAIVDNCVLNVSFAPTILGSFSTIVNIVYESTGQQRVLNLVFERRRRAGRYHSRRWSFIDHRGPTPVLADGTSMSSVVVTLRDADDRPVPGLTSELDVTGTGNLITPCTVSDGAGPLELRRELDARRGQGDLGGEAPSSASRKRHHNARHRSSVR